MTEINDVACEWVARLDRAPLSSHEQQQLDTWLAADKRHLGAFARARAVSVHFDRAQALGSGFDPAQFQTAAPAPRLRRSTRWMAIAASVAAVAVLAGVLSGPRGALATKQGEVRLVPLEDGSAVTLNTATRLAVRYSEAERQVSLIEGEALFNVAKDASRPFVVRAGETRIRAIGTSFTVRHLAGEDVKVVVREGVVEVTRESDSSIATPVRVSANALAYSGSKREPLPVAVPVSEVARELAWQQGMISLDGMTLGEAAREFARYSPVSIVIDDPEISRRTVTGLFAANNPVGFARAVATSMDLKAQVAPDSVRITH